jgi:16S rRNA (guanine527-N7)-methyltransferase
MNLTALTAPEDVSLKHFADSLTLLKYCEVEEGASVIDVGTGAGFPGMVIKIARPDIQLTLLDSLQKRLGFLDEVCNELGFDDVELIHSRAEDGSRTELRDSFDIAVSRAVASLNTLCEYDMPYVKVGGRFIAMKGKEAQEEMAAAENAIHTLGGELLQKHDFILGEAGERSIIEIKKIAATPDAYPRRSKHIKNKPL